MTNSSLFNTTKTPEAYSDLSSYIYLAIIAGVAAVGLMCCAFKLCTTPKEQQAEAAEEETPRLLGENQPNPYNSTYEIRVLALTR